MRNVLCAVCAALFLSGTASAVVVDFNDGADWSKVEDGFGGFVWSDDGNGFRYAPKWIHDSSYAILHNGSPSDSYAPDETISTVDGSVVSFLGGDFFARGAAYGLEITITSFIDGVENGSFTVTDLLQQDFTSYEFILIGNSFQFSAGGEPQPNPLWLPAFDWIQYSFAVDNLRFESAPTVENPIPAAGIMLLTGLAGLAFGKRKKA